MRKKSIVILLTVIIFIAAAFVGVSAVFRVNSVQVISNVTSEIAHEEAALLQEKLKDAYKSDSSFFADEEKVEKVLQEFPYFRLTSFEKIMPNKIVIEVKEEVETFAVKMADSDLYYITNEQGYVLAIREDASNRLDGFANVIIDGEALNISGKVGQKLTGDEFWTALIVFCGEMSTRLNGVRDNIQSITIAKFEPEFRIVMREGVKILLSNPEECFEEKAKAAIEKYLSLSDKGKTYGEIKVTIKDGEIKLYHPSDLNGD